MEEGTLNKRDRYGFCLSETVLHSVRSNTGDSKMPNHDYESEVNQRRNNTVGKEKRNEAR